ncbi:hypothetical protein D3C81_1747800 [compost metagenome]
MGALDGGGVVKRGLGQRFIVLLLSDLPFRQQKLKLRLALDVLLQGKLCRLGGLVEVVEGCLGLVQLAR